MSLTAANSVITLSQATLFPTPQQLQGFSTDDVTDVDPADILEALMGVDGVLSFGFVWKERHHEITLQADSASNDFFDTINNQQQAVTDVYPLNGVILLPSISRMFTLVNGALMSYKPIPQVQKILRPRKYRLVWNQIIPSPAA